MIKKLFFLIYSLSVISAGLNAAAVPDRYTKPLEELNGELELHGVPSGWLKKNIDNPDFEIYENIEKYFKVSPEHKVSSKEKDLDWYKQYFDVDTKIKHGLDFIGKNLAILEKIQARNGIPLELIVSEFGMETHYGVVGVKRGFYVFCSFISQYLLIPTLKDYAVNELVALYQFSEKTGKPVYYFIGSYAGASGLGQFIPSSLLRYFISSNGNDKDIDIYSVDDSLYSIDNYLFHSGLNRLTAGNRKAIYKAVYSYNPSEAYVHAVMYIYDELKRIRDASRDSGS